MYDLLLSKNGDILFSEYEENNALKINFFKSKCTTLKIDFTIDKIRKSNKLKNCLVIDFFYENNKNNKIALDVQGDEYIMQQIYIRLKTSLGELPLRTTIGSKLETVMHKNIADKFVLKEIENLTLSAIKDIVDLNIFSVEASIFKSPDFQFKHGVLITIKKENDIFLNYEMR